MRMAIATRALHLQVKATLVCYVTSSKPFGTASELAKV